MHCITLQILKSVIPLCIEYDISIEGGTNEMYGDIFVRSLLEKYISQGIKKFVIYPFGENGVTVKNVLRNYFGLDPCLIVDNECSKYNHEIVNKEALKESYRKDMHIILTVERPDLNNKMYRELLEFVPLSNIINLGEKMQLFVTIQYFV